MNRPRASNGVEVDEATASDYPTKSRTAERPLTEETSVGEDFLSRADRPDAFLTRLARMSKEERVRAARYGGFTRWERSVWAARFPTEVPLVNGEIEWIVLASADLD